MAFPGPELSGGRPSNERGPTPTAAVLRHLAGRDPKHGPLPPLLLGLTFASGLVDAVSIVKLGQVFVANMTGNIVFTGFAIGGAPGFSVSRTLIALAAFLVGAGLEGVLIGARGSNRGEVLAIGVAVEIVFVVVACIVVAVSGSPLAPSNRTATLIILAIGLGVQNAVARRLAVPDFTTTVLTMTLTGIAADAETRTGRAAALRRLTVIVAMVAGGAVGVIMELHVGIVAALLVLVATLVIVATVAAVASRRPGEWAVRG